MTSATDRIQNLLTDLRIPQIDFSTVFKNQNDLTPLEAVERFLQEYQRIKIEKQNLIRRKRAALLAEKTLQSFDFGFQKNVSKGKCSDLVI